MAEPGGTLNVYTSPFGRASSAVGWNVLCYVRGMKAGWAICAVALAFCACADETGPGESSDARSGGSGSKGVPVGTGASGGQGGKFSMSGGGSDAAGMSGVAGASGSGGVAGKGGQEDCVITDDHAEIRVSGVGPGGLTQSVMDGEFTGKVLSVAADQFDVDVCASMDGDGGVDGGCVGQRRSIHISAPGLDLTTLLGADDLVRVKLYTACIIGCFPSILVTSEPRIGDLVNPHPAPSGVYVAASEGVATAFEEGGFTVERTRLSCRFSEGASPACGGPNSSGAYAFRFTDIASGRSTEVSMGQTSGFLLRGQSVQVHDLRSYDSGACDAFDDAYWLASRRDGTGADL